MIIPWFLGFRDFVRAPMTWTLITLCFLVYLATWQLPMVNQSPLFEKRNLIFSGILYLQYQRKELLPEPIELALVGHRALRDPQFVRDAADFAFAADAGDLAAWRKNMQEYHDISQTRSLYKYGLRRDPTAGVRKPLTWITYQFMHADAFHLLGNLLFLVLFGVVIESLVGGLWVAAVFLVSGVMGAIFMLAADAATALPMVGASASISGLIGFYVIVEQKKRVRFFYFFSPFKDFYGHIFMSKWWVLPLCVLPDVANWFAEKYSTQPNFTSIATSAHVGGAIFGLALALVARSLGMIKHSPEQIPAALNFPSRSEAP